MTSSERSMLVISPNEAFFECLRDVFNDSPELRYTTEFSTLASLNGHASEVAAQHDVVIFDANPDDEDEVNAIATACSENKGRAAFVALTGNDVTVAKARRLREIGIDEVLPVSLTGPELSSAIDDTLSRKFSSTVHMQSPDSREAVVIPVAQARGGIGATTVAVNLACALRGRNSMFRKGELKKVALLDFDLQFGNANVHLDLEDNGGFMAMIEEEPDPDFNYLKGIMQEHPSGITLLSSPATITPLSSLSPHLVANILKALRREFDYIVIDLPRALVDWIEPVLDCTTQIVMVTDTTVPSLRQAKRMIDFFREEHLGLPVEVVVNREKRGFLASEQTREAEKLLDMRLRHWLPDNPKLSRKSVDLGRPAIQLKPSADVPKAISKLAATLTAPIQKNATKSV